MFARVITPANSKRYLKHLIKRSANMKQLNSEFLSLLFCTKKSPVLTGGIWQAQGLESRTIVNESEG
jgi:hypothetical protein